MQKRAPALPAIGGGQHPLLQFGPGNWQWIQSVRMAWWDHWRTSSYNGVKGSWVTFGNQTFYPYNGTPSYPNGPPIPAVSQRS
jgi:hypothetical protein